MRRLVSLLLLTAACALAQGGKTPRPLTPFEFSLPGGQKANVSQCQGKVCVIEFLYTTCPACQQTGAVLTYLNRELGPQGFQPLGIAMNEGANLLVPDFVRKVGINYPVGYANREQAMAYLGYSITARMLVPQIVITDKKGMIRYQSSLEANENLHDPSKLKQILTDLLKEPDASAAKKAPAKAAPAKAAKKK